MKKIGIITFSAADNFGALMQCYALRKYLTQRGYDVEVINYWPSYLRKEYRLMFNWEELRSGVQSGLKCLWRSVIYIRFKNLPKAISKQRKMNYFRKNYLNITKKCRNLKELKNLPPYQLYIAGSDQIWNPELTGGKLDPVFFLNFAPANARKVSYAASTGNAPSKDMLGKYKYYMKNLDYISVREKKTADILAKITDKKVHQDKDPTLLLDRKSWEKLLLKDKEKKPYIFFFSLYYQPEQFQYVNKLSERNKMPIKHYFYGRLAKRLVNNGGSCYFDSPQELLTKIKNAAYVVTDSFHVTVFSILFEKRFVTFPSGKWNERIENLLEEYHLADHLIRKEK